MAVIISFSPVFPFLLHFPVGVPVRRGFESNTPQARHAFLPRHTPPSLRLPLTSNVSVCLFHQSLKASASSGGKLFAELRPFVVQRETALLNICRKAAEIAA